MLCNDIYSTHHVNNPPNLLTMLNVSYHIISVIFFRLAVLVLVLVWLIRLQVPSVTLPVGEGLTPQVLSHAEHTPQETKHMFRSLTA